MMVAKHHPSDDVLLAYASGALREEAGLVVATHLALCPRCREEVAMAEAIGGAAFDEIQPSSMQPSALDSVMARLDDAGSAPDDTSRDRRPTPFADPGAEVIPEPLRGYLDGRLDSLPWRRLGPDVREFSIISRPGGATARLLRIAPGKTLPEHGHRGDEHTLVLKGCFFDGDEVFSRGDVESAHGEAVHQPVSGPDEECICLVVTDAPLRFTGLMERILQPFIRI